MPSTLVTLIGYSHQEHTHIYKYSPREAASTIVKLVNSKNINQAMLALTLLDNCVKNCGYPFHLQIATKEFLNELVKKFPERPAPFPNPVTQRILYLIKEWKVALADMSKHKDDLVHIKDMYRLLRFKGYRFPELKDASIAALAPSESLKSAHELEEEDRLAQSAKLQELIRRGRPQDLVEANRLMKIMSGYDTRQVPDYSQKFEDELHKVQEKAILLYEMLETVKPGDSIEHNDTIVDLKSACASAQPKIQKLITEEEDNDKIENLLTLNDMINNVMAKYADIRKGLFDTHYEISGKPPSANTNSGEEPKQAISLIDLDDDNTGNGQSTGAGQSTNVLNELSDIFGSNVAISPPNNNNNNHNNTMVDIFGSTTTVANSTTNNNDLFDLLGGSQSTSNNTTLVNKNGLHIELNIKQVDTKYYIKAYFSNLSTAPMDRLMLRLAAPKSMQIKMEPQSSQTLPPKSTRSVTQNIVINNSNKENLRLRYKVSYEQFGVDMELAGDFHA
ncbi:VHS-domain-containing protein [Rhizopus microsporus var. microsporus]|uniref:VHS-domain-containing protein n=1 Tax=Rhizopus microsporus var. microsporus TaxID=86635 RepID=A0A1X0RBJ8_RHIZD|nr:VHS-domain-containing protein [Rhizopus microsporus var. microsporus]